MDKVREITELFGGGPLAAFIALLCVAVVVLFVALQRSEREHLKSNHRMTEVAEKLGVIIGENTAVLRSCEEELERALQGAHTRRRTRTGETTNG